MSMKQGARLLFCLAGSLALAGSVRAATATLPAISTERQTTVMDNPYNPIVERNVFDLHDPPPPPEPKSTNAPPPNIHLTGITTILGKKQAYFMVQSAPMGGKPAQDKYMTLAEGQRQEMLEVLEINPKSKLVKISNSGNISTITFETNKIAFNGNPGGAAGGANFQPHVGGLQPAQPGGPAPNYYPNNPAVAPPRPMRPTTTSDATPYGGAGGQYGGYQANASGNIASGYGNTAYNNYNNYNQGVQNTARQPVAPVMDPEQQIVLMELQREATKQQVSTGQMPPLPPTPLSQMMQQEQQQQQNNGAPAPVLPNFPGQHNTIK